MLLLFFVLVIKPRALNRLGKYYATESFPDPLPLLLTGGSLGRNSITEPHSQPLVFQSEAFPV